MAAINVGYNSDIIYENVIDNTIILKNKETGETIYTFPIPKNFQIAGKISTGENHHYYIITPYKLNQPNFIPTGYGHLSLGPDGSWRVNNGKRELAYIDTTLLSEKDYEYTTIGRFEITNDQIPEPFWVPEFRSLECCYHNPDNIYPWNIPQVIKQYGEGVRLIYEEELVSIFALNDLGLEFWEYISDKMDEERLFAHPEQYHIVAQDLCLDNWRLIVASREDRNKYKMMRRERTRWFNEEFWFQSFNYINTDRVHVWPVFENPKIKEKRNTQSIFHQ